MSACGSTTQSVLAPFDKRKKYLIGVSGGLDSMVLLSLLREEGFRAVVVCHLDHGLRSRDAAEDLAVVAEASRKFGYPLEFGECNARAHAKSCGISLEMAARELRFKFFESCGASHRCRRLFLAHHQDDQVETILLNLVRGTGLAGLSGMAPETSLGRMLLLRPLLAVTRKTLESIARDAGIAFREDPTNRSPAHTRNRVRQWVVPAMKKTFGDDWSPGLLRMADIARAENACLDSLVPEPGSVLAVRDLRAQPLALQRRIALRWLRNHRVPTPGFAEAERLLTLLDVENGPSKINLPLGCHARRRAGQIFFEAPFVTKL